MYHKTITKQSSCGIVAHVYEHLVANRIHSFLWDNYLLPLIDYELDATTEDGIVIVAISSYNDQLIQKAILSIQHCLFSKKEVEAAVKQISAEYQCPYETNLDLLVKDIQTMESQQWLDLQQDLKFTEPITDTARSLKSQHLSYLEQNKNDFREYSCTYELTNCTRELKPLAVYAVQIIALAFINFLYQQFQYIYDAGDEWAKYQDLIGYCHYIRFSKDDQLTPNDLRAAFSEFKQQLAQFNFIDNLIKFMKQQAKLDYRQMYFSVDQLFACAYVLPGRKGLEVSATEENIRFVLDNLVIKCENTNLLGQ